MWKYAVAIAFCLCLIGVSAWGSVTYYPASSRAVVGPEALMEMEAGVRPEVPSVVTDNVAAAAPAYPAPVTDNISSPVGSGVVRASFTVVG